MTRLVNNSEEAEKYVDDLIQQHAVMVFSKGYCPYCVKVFEFQYFRIYHTVPLVK